MQAYKHNASLPSLPFSPSSPNTYYPSPSLQYLIPYNQPAQPDEQQPKDQHSKLLLATRGRTPQARYSVSHAKADYAHLAQTTQPVRYSYTLQEAQPTYSLILTKQTKPMQYNPLEDGSPIPTIAASEILRESSSERGESLDDVANIKNVTYYPIAVDGRARGTGAVGFKGIKKYVKGIKKYVLR